MSVLALAVALTRLRHPTVGETDCENLGAGFLAQPVNALTSLAYCVVGVVVIVLAWRWQRWRARTVIFGACLIATGIGSVLFHGPQPSGSKFLHDVPIVLALLLMALHNLSLIVAPFRHVAATFGVVALAAGAISVVLPDAATVATGLFGVVTVVTEVIVYRRGLREGSAGRQRRLYIAIVGVTAVAASMWVLGRTDGPVCDPDSVLQLHGLWHLISAVAFGLWWWLALAERSPGGSAASPSDAVSAG
jgi:hypothetical protein